MAREWRTALGGGWSCFLLEHFETWTVLGFTAMCVLKFGGLLSDGSLLGSTGRSVFPSMCFNSVSIRLSDFLQVSGKLLAIYVCICTYIKVLQKNFLFTLYSNNVLHFVLTEQGRGTGNLESTVPLYSFWGRGKYSCKDSGEVSRPFAKLWSNCF